MEPGRTNPIHIGLNAHLLSLSEDYRAAGISWYIYNLIRQLPVVAPQHRYTAFLSERRIRQQPPTGLNLRLSRWPTVHPPLRILWEQILQPVELVRSGIDLLHSLAFVRPAICLCPSVLTIYDLSFIFFPESFKGLNRWYLTCLTRYSARRADRIIAISESTKRGVVSQFGVKESQVDVVYCGVDDIFRPMEDGPELRAFRARRGLPERMILFVGTLEPRKNVARLIEAFAWLKRDQAVPHKLVIAGAKGWFHRQIFARVEELGLRSEVILAGYVQQQELPWWYNAADLFVYPSLYEGFGLPPLEAMACGTPTITSWASSLPEVVGEAGLMVAPQDTEALAEAMRRVLADEALRQTLRMRGLERASRFSWLEAARMTARTYERVMDERGR